jgi:hypothetical protein
LSGREKASNFSNEPRARQNWCVVVKTRRSRVAIWILAAVLPLGASAWTTALFARPKPAPKHAESGRPRAVTYVGFYVFRDGSSRIYVNLTSDVPVEAKNHGRVVEYLLKDTKILVPNNKNPLITEHFGSPVVSAQMLPVKEGAVLRIELRQAMKPAHEMHPHVDKSATLYINFPRPK